MLTPGCHYPSNGYLDELVHLFRSACTGLAVIIDRSNCHVCIIFSAIDDLIILSSNLFYCVAYYCLVILMEIMNTPPSNTSVLTFRCILSNRPY